jgi:oxygen-independent coproporphyrinogen-3 oxidase
MTTTTPHVDAAHEVHHYEHYRQQAIAYVQSIDIATLAAEGLLPSPNETYLTGTYPPLKAMRPITAEEVFHGATSLLNIYLHIPFCRQRCTFCHFAKEIRPGQDRVRAYLDALVAEMALVRRKFEGRPRVASVYFGVGTPSFLAPEEMELLFTALHENFLIGPDTEVTFELHPQIADDPSMAARKLRVMAHGGVNRIAFGAQTLDDRVLRVLNRGHVARRVFDLLDILPYETLDGWYSTLTGLVNHGVSKLNIFPLFLKVTDPISSLYERKPHLFPGAGERLAAHSLAESVLFDRGFLRGPVLYYSLAEHHSRQQESKRSFQYGLDSFRTQITAHASVRSAWWMSARRS